MDDAIIRKVLDGDIREFKHLISKYKDSSFNLARSLIKSDLTAEEAVQDAFIKAFQNLHKFRKKAAFSTWLYRIVVNESLKKVKKKEIEYTELNTYKLPVEDITIFPDALEKLHIEEQKEFINQTLEKLRSTESLLLKLFYLEEKKMEEIKQISGLSLSNIKVILHRARKHFALIYQEQFIAN